MSGARAGVVAARLLLTVVVAVGIAVPVGAYVYAHHLVLLGARESTPRVSLPPSQLASYASYARTGPSTFVVLGYDDLTLRPPASSATTAGRTVGAGTFAAQLAMLRAAGFTSVSDAQVAAYLRDRTPLPQHSVLITFDGGRERDWTLGDDILARYGFRAVVFIDPTLVGGRGSGYLSWTQLAEMASSRRWSVALDIANAAATVPLNAAGNPAPGLLSHAWLTAAARNETTAEFQARIRTGLTVEIDALHKHLGIAASLIAYPFDAHYPLARAGSAFDELARVVNSLATAGVLTITPDTAVTDFYRSERLMPMLAVYSTTTTNGLFDRISAAAS